MWAPPRGLKTQDQRRGGNLPAETPTRTSAERSMSWWRNRRRQQRLPSIAFLTDRRPQDRGCRHPTLRAFSAGISCSRIQGKRRPAVWSASNSLADWDAPLPGHGLRWVFSTTCACEGKVPPGGHFALQHNMCLLRPPPSKSCSAALVDPFSTIRSQHQLRTRPPNRLVVVIPSSPDVELRDMHVTVRCCSTLEYHERMRVRHEHALRTCCIAILAPAHGGRSE